MFRDCDKKKLRISKRRICLVLKRSVDKRNLFVLEWKLIPLLRRGICLFGNVANQNRFQFLNLMESSSRFIVSKAVLIPDCVLTTNAWLLFLIWNSVLFQPIHLRGNDVDINFFYLCLNNTWLCKSKELWKLEHSDDLIPFYSTELQGCFF